MRKKVYSLQFTVYNILFFLALLTVHCSLCTICYAKEITIIYTGSTHGMVYPCSCPIEPDGGIARRATLVKQLRKEKFVVFPTGDDEVFLSEKKTAYGARLAGHYAATERLTLLANAGLELVTGFTRASSSPDHYSAWIQFGAGATYNLPGRRKQALVGEINGETIADAPFHTQIVSPIEWLLGYKTQLTPGLSLQLGGGRGFNKGIGAPQWRAFAGVAYAFAGEKAAPPPPPPPPPPSIIVSSSKNSMFIAFALSIKTASARSALVR